MLQKEKWKVVETLTVHAIGSYKVGLVVKGEGREGKVMGGSDSPPLTKN